MGLLYELRPWQWYKQLIMFVALIFSGMAGESVAWLRVAAGAIVFSAIAGSTYILNDISDVGQDRNHPRKRHRPIASGQVSIPVALGFAAVTYVTAAVAAWRLDPLVLGLIAVYIGQNLLYSYKLKQYLFLDLFSISAGFVIRVVIGIVLIDAQLSSWILLCTFLGALLLGVSKRWGEREEAENPDAVRENLDGYSMETLRFLFGSVATMVLISYSLYTFFVRDLLMMLTIPFAFYAVFRFAHLTFVNGGASEPRTLLLDRALVWNFLLWGVIVVVLLYRPELGVTI